MRLKRFTREGHEEYRKWLEDGKVTPHARTNVSILNMSEEYVNLDGNAIEVNIQHFGNSLLFAEHVFTKLSRTTEKIKKVVIRILDDPLVAD